MEFSFSLKIREQPENSPSALLPEYSGLFLYRGVLSQTIKNYHPRVRYS